MYSNILSFVLFWSSLVWIHRAAVSQAEQKKSSPPSDLPVLLLSTASSIILLQLARVHIWAQKETSLERRRERSVVMHHHLPCHELLWEHKPMLGQIFSGSSCRRWELDLWQMQFCPYAKLFARWETEMRHTPDISRSHIRSPYLNTACLHSMLPIPFAPIALLISARIAWSLIKLWF